MMPRETPEEAERRRARDLHELRILAWCVQRNKYNREPMRVDGGHRGRVRFVTLTFYLEMPDYRETDREVRALLERRGEKP